MGLFDDIMSFAAPVVDPIKSVFNGITGAVSAAGPMLDFAGGLMTNSANSAQTQQNRDFQAQMSSTSHQREVADLQAAGLNPILSANSGASSPAGSTVSLDNPFSSGIGDANSAQKIGVDKVNAETAQKAQANAAQLQSSTIDLQASNRSLNSELSNKAKADTEASKAQAELTAQNTASKFYETTVLQPLQAELIKNQTMREMSTTGLNSAGAARQMSEKILNDLEYNSTKNNLPIRKWLETGKIGLDAVGNLTPRKSMRIPYQP